jgi:NAD(P)-dependent dehydrogenase (short-subunit alcohol dehydrogenase family)
VSYRIRGRMALVTGAGGGLGRAISAALAEQGAQLLLVGRDEAKLGDTQRMIGERCVRVEPCDVSDPEQVSALAARTTTDNVSILVNNAGIAGPVRALVDVSPAEWDAVFAANVVSVFLMCRSFLPAMLSRGDGDIVNIASVTGKRPLARRTPYAASKMALIGLTRTLAQEVGPAGVRVNSLSPGPVRGERMNRNFRLEGEVTGTSAEIAEAALVARTAMGRLVEEREVAEAVVAMLALTALTAADIDLSAGMIAP